MLIYLVLIHSSKNVFSITIPVNEGDKIWATSFQGKNTNGSSINGIRITWFSENGVLQSLSADEVYSELLLNGYLTVPNNAVAINIPMWNNSSENEVYILNKEHIYHKGICLGCNTEEPYEIMNIQYDDHI